MNKCATLESYKQVRECPYRTTPDLSANTQTFWFAGETKNKKTMRLNKKGSGYANMWLTVVGVSVVLLVVGLGVYTDWFGWMEAEEPTTSPDYVPPSTAGDQGTLKFSVVSSSNDAPSQFAGTGYCWDDKSPSNLLESISGKTLSATAGTTFAPAYRGHTYTCTAFDSSHWCEHESGKMVDEGLNLRGNCYNISSSSQIDITYYEQDSPESTNSINLGANAEKSYNKFALEVNISQKTFPLGAICFGTNATTSHLDKMNIVGWNKDEVPAHLGTNADDYCFTPPKEYNLKAYEFTLFPNSIVFEADSTGTGTTEERINVTLHDLCEYVAPDGKIYRDYFKRLDPDEGDCGSGVIQPEYIVLS